MLPTNHRMAISIARADVTKRLPYFSSMLLMIVPRPVPGYGTFGMTRKMIMVYDPALAETWEPKKVSFVVAHELFHHWLRHNPRADALNIVAEIDAKLFNIACDQWINAMLRPAYDGWVPDDAVLPDRLPVWMQQLGIGDPLPENCAAERAYWILKERYHEKMDELSQALQQMMQNAPAAQQQQQSGGDQNSAGGGINIPVPTPAQGQQQGAQIGTGQGSGSNQNAQTQSKGTDTGGAGDDAAEQQPQLPTVPSGSVCSGHCGSAAGHALPDEPEDADPDGREQNEIDASVRTVARAMQEHAKKSRGSVPGGLLLEAELVIAPPKIAWNQKLRRIERNSVTRKRLGAALHDFTRPSRRQYAYGHGAPILPKTVSPALSASIVVDSSGSMSHRELKRALIEGYAVFKQCGMQDVSFMSCDAKVHSFEKLKKWQDVLKLLKGGGGTDFRPVFEHFEKLPKKKQPDILLFCTDGQGPAPSVKPKIKSDVIWLLIGSGACKPVAVSDDGYLERPIDWGTFIEVPSYDSMSEEDRA